MNVTIRQLRAFLRVAELGHFNLAANELGLTQSAVSILIRELESQLGVRLFDRNTRMVVLSGAGEDFLPQARKVLQDLDRATQSARDSAALKRGQVTIAAAIVPAATIVPRLMAEFMRRHPQIQVQLSDMAEEQIAPAIKRNEVDIALGTHLEDDPEIMVTPVIRDRLMLTCHDDNPLARRKRVSWSELAGEKVIVLNRNNPLRTIVERAMLQISPDFQPDYEVRFSSTAIGMISAGIGVSILPENARLLAPAGKVRTVELVNPVISREIVLLQHRRRGLSPAAARLREMILEGATIKSS